MPRVSVVIPAYNAERYLRAAVESALAARLDLEVLIVDDGSSDGTWEVIRGLAGEHDAVCGLRQARARQGAARNRALRHARGEYVQFLDADDLLPAGALEAMVAVADRDGCQMVAGVQESFSPRRRWVGVPVHQEAFSQPMRNISIRDMPALLADISACNRLIRREFIEQYALRFPEHTAGEDMQFMAELYLRAERISILPRVVYRYRAVQGSRTGRVSARFFRERAEVCLALAPCFETLGCADLFPFLARSEARKLLGPRFGRMVAELPPAERDVVFDVLIRLLDTLDLDTALNSGDWDERRQIRAILLVYREFDALVLLEQGGRPEPVLEGIEQDAARRRAAPCLQRLRHAATLRGRARGWLQRVPMGCLAHRTAGSVWRLLRRARWVSPRAVGWFAVAMPVAALVNRARGRSAWLLDERVSTSAEDNAYVLFRHLREQHPELVVRFVLRRDSPHWPQVCGDPHVVACNSFRHLYWLCQARVLLSTDSFRSLDFRKQLFPGYAGGTCNVFLQHGVMGNKTTTYSRQNHPYFNRVVVSSEREHAMLVEHYGFAENQVIVSGLPRFDRLAAGRPRTGRRRVLVSPTWRRWLMKDRDISSSEFFNAWRGLLTSHELEQVLERHDCELVFRPHFRMLDFADAFETGSSRVTVLREREVDLSGWIRACDVLVTDYSSVMYDFFYQDKPVVAYMFDRVEWETQELGPPHLDFDQDLPLDIGEAPAQVAAALDAVLSRGARMTEEQQALVPACFAFRGGGHSEALVASIRQCLEQSAPKA